MLIVKKESCEYQFYIFWLDPTENRITVGLDVSAGYTPSTKD